MLNKTKGNMYEWVTETRNFIGGECPHRCKYCFVNHLKNKFPNIKERYSGEIRLIEKELKKNEGSGKTIFIQDMSDLFAENVPREFILKILSHLNDYPNNTYLFQTKNPKRFLDFIGFYPKNTIICTTIETNRENDLSNAPKRRERAFWMASKVSCGELNELKRRSVTLEPLMDFDLEQLVELIKKIEPEFVSVGADSKNSYLLEPSKEKVLALIKELNKFTKVIQKDNLRRLLK